MHDKYYIRKKVFAYKYALEHNSQEHCKRIIAELEKENFHKVVKCLLTQNYDAICNIINWKDDEHTC